MRFRRQMVALASALLPSVSVWLIVIVTALAGKKEPWNIADIWFTLVFARDAFVVALAHALVLGLPLFFLLRSKMSVGVVTCGVGGFLVGALPWVVIHYFDTSTTFPPLYSGAFGLAGGLTFWIAVRFSGQMAVKPNEPPGNCWVSYAPDRGVLFRWLFWRLPPFLFWPAWSWMTVAAI